MDITREQPIRCYRAGLASARADTLVVETRVELDINDGRLRWAMLCLPENLDALAVGFLRSEGVLRSRADLHTFTRFSLSLTLGGFVCEEISTKTRWTR